MDEEIAIITANSRNEKIKNFFINNKKRLIIFLTVVILIIFVFFINQDFKEKKFTEISNKYNFVVTNFIAGNKINSKKNLIEIINKHNETYSPLALYFLIDNNIIEKNSEINQLFDVLINEIKLEKEIKNLIIYKKALFNSEVVDENNLIEMLNPITKSNSMWKSHALYLIAEYFFAKNEKQKAKEFFEEILSLENSNRTIRLEAQKRLTRDLSD